MIALQKRKLKKNLKSHRVNKFVSEITYR